MAGCEQAVEICARSKCEDEGHNDYRKTNGVDTVPVVSNLSSHSSHSLLTCSSYPVVEDDAQS